MNIITIGIDLANNVFALHGVNEAGKPELVKPKVPRDQSWRSGSQPDVAVLAQHSNAIGDIPKGYVRQRCRQKVAALNIVRPISIFRKAYTLGFGSGSRQGDKCNAEYNSQTIQS